MVWQAREAGAQQSHEAHFKALLGDVDTPTAPYGLLDTRGGAQAVQEATLGLDPSLAAALRQQARQAGVSPASLMHLAWGLVLARTQDMSAEQTGRDDVVFGTVLLGRTQAGHAQALGMFINTLPLRLALGEIAVADALQATQAQLAALLRHEHAPLALAQRCSAVRAPTPLFSALFNYRGAMPGNDAATSIGQGDILWASNSPATRWRWRWTTTARVSRWRCRRCSRPSLRVWAR